MKKVLVMAMVLLVALSGAAMANAWIVGAPTEFNGNNWVTQTGAGYNGGDAYSHNGTAGDIARAYWQFDFSDMSDAAFLANVWVYIPTAGTMTGYQPVEVLYSGADENGNPWAGQYGTNHQWIAKDWNSGAAGSWMQLGPGPQTPDGGSQVYVKKGSKLFVKFDFPWAINNTVSAVALTTNGDSPVPEPSSLVALLAGLPALAIFRKRS